MDAPTAAARIPVPAWRWIPATFLGWTAGLILAIALVIGVDAVGISGAQSPLALGMGLGVGLLQGRIVAPLVGGARAWVAATTLGLSLPFAIGDVLRLVGLSVYSLAAFVGIGGALAGVLQWRLLRAPAVAGTGWWPVITPIGWILAGSTVWLNEWLPKVPGLIGLGRYLGVVLAGGLVLGLAAALAWRLGQPRKRR